MSKKQACFEEKQACFFCVKGAKEEESEGYVG